MFIAVSENEKNNPRQILDKVAKATSPLPQPPPMMRPADLLQKYYEYLATLADFNEATALDLYHWSSSLLYDVDYIRADWLKVRLVAAEKAALGDPKQLNKQLAEAERKRNEAVERRGEIVPRLEREMYEAGQAVNAIQRQLDRDNEARIKLEKVRQNEPSLYKAIMGE